jgi:hypothetical protein
MPPPSVMATRRMRNRRTQGYSRGIRTSSNGQGCTKLASVGATLCPFVRLEAHLSAGEMAMRLLLSNGKDSSSISRARSSG